jgi:hypothetical protein
LNSLDVVLAAEAHRLGRALRTVSVRQRKLVEDPLAIVLWQLGAEPFSAAAIGYGTQPDQLQTHVAGEPRNRDLAFAALLPLAEWFNARFEEPAQVTETVGSDDRPIEIATTAPQVVVANDATVALLGRLGRRLAYLPLVGEYSAPAALVRFGQHLQFLALHAGVPGQQLILSMTRLAGAHWATPQSAIERQSLAALDAYIDPPAGQHGFDAAALAEKRGVGPLPDGDADERLDPLVERFNRQRNKSTEAHVVRPLLAPIEVHYAPLISRTWSLLWRGHARERALPEAPSVERRWKIDREAYSRHIEWTDQSGRRKTRQSPRQTARMLRKLEAAQRRLDAEEACEDPLRLIPLLLDNKAVRGSVEAIDLEHREVANVRPVRRPLVTVRCEEPCLMPKGKELYWTETPGGPCFSVHSVSNEGKTLVLKLETGSNKVALPSVGDEATFSVLSTKVFDFAQLPPQDPWTHKASQLEEPKPIEEPQ